MSGEEGRPSTARARELGSALKRIRERAGLNGNELARMLGWSASKVTRMEKGTRGMTETDVAMYSARCGASATELDRLLALARETDDTYRLQSHGQRLPDELRSLIVHETTARAITGYEPLLVPGMLQTEDYARALFHWAALHPEEGIELRVRARMSRQSLLRRRQPPRFQFLIHEQALRSVVGGPRVMHEQLLHVLFATSLPHCTVRVIPSAAGPYGAFGGTFWLMQYAEHPPVVYVQNETSTLFREASAEVAAYRKILHRVAANALDERQSREWLAQSASEHDRPEDGPP